MRGPGQVNSMRMAVALSGAARLRSAIHPGGDIGGEIGFAGQDAADRFDQLFAAFVFSYVTVSAGAKGGFCGCELVVHGEDQQLDAWATATNLAKQLKAIATPQPQVHDRQIGLQERDLPQRLGHGASGAADFEVGLMAKQHLEATAHGRLVVYHEQPYLGRLPLRSSGHR